jgi:GTP cyclohydrolase II
MITNEIKYNDGSVETLLFDPVPHKYYWNKKPIVSATNVTKLLTPANVIGLWSAKMCAEKFKHLVEAGKSYDEIQLIDFYDRIKKAPNDVLTSAGSVGSIIHDFIENYIHTGKVPEMHNEQIIKSFGKFKEWFDSQEDIEIVSTEFRVLSRIHKFCGTVDALFKNKKTGKYIVYDWKTSSGIRSSYYCQIYLYKLAICEMYGYEIEEGVIVNATKEGKLNVKSFKIDAESDEVALACLKMHNFLNPKKKESK